MKKRLLSVLMALTMLVGLLPMAALAVEPDDQEVTYVASIGIAQNKDAAKAKAALAGHTIIDVDLNKGAGGDYVYMGYTTTTDPTEAITGIVLRVGKNPPDTIRWCPAFSDNALNLLGGDITYYLVGGSREPNTSSQGGWIDLNGRAGGDYIYMYVARDNRYEVNRSAPIRELTVTENIEFKNGWTTVTNTDIQVQDLNDGAGGKYLYLHSRPFHLAGPHTFNYLQDDSSNYSTITYQYIFRDHLEFLYSMPSVSEYITHEGQPYKHLGWRLDDTPGEPTGTSAYWDSGYKVFRAVYSADLTLNYDARGGDWNGEAPTQGGTRYINSGSSGVPGIAMTKLSFTIPPAPEYKEGYHFHGWSTDPSSAKATYQPGDEIELTRDTTLYAIAGEPSYEVYLEYHYSTYSCCSKRELKVHDFWTECECGMAPYLYYSPSSHTITLDGQPVSVGAYTINGNNYFKLRDLAALLTDTQAQFQVNWEPSTRTITLNTGEAYTFVGGELAKLDGQKLPLRETKASIFVDAQSVTFESYNIGGNNYFKLRDLGKALGFNVSWDDATRTVSILTEEPYSE